ncbi:winged helix-turn-helix transcriptional regulator [Rhodopirellula sp. JC639]|uniref:winged helix-turn-helix transcriptional regulator n=1 Tax=Stieleria mannarensis TaxID=2755585 RepID=UPI0016012B95|nr:winged helix-turn-helix transcriptional regulator [Rhodopirellula sp. JC639]
MAKKANKQEKVIDYLKKNPEATIADTAKACNVSVPTVSAAKRKAGLTRRSAKAPATRKGAKGNASSVMDQLEPALMLIQSCGDAKAAKAAIDDAARVLEIARK